MTQSRSPHRVIAERVKALRKGRGWSAQRLADEMTRVGISWDRSIVANLENGRRAVVSVEEWLTLAYVLDVAPVHLLVPTTGTTYRVLPQPRAGEQYERDAEVYLDDVRQWISGKQPLPGTDLRVYYSEVPEDEFRERFGRGSRAEVDDGR